MGRRDIRHRCHGRVDRADVGHGVALDQHPAVSAQPSRQLPASLHRFDRERIGLADHRHGGDHRDRRVAAAEHEVVPVLDREAVRPVRFAARRLREPLAPWVELEEVRLHVDHPGGARGSVDELGGLGDVAARRVADLEDAAALEPEGPRPVGGGGLQGSQPGGHPRRRDQEPPP